MSASNYQENVILDAMLGSGSPATVYVALHTGSPGETGASNEVSGGAYARVSKTNNGTNFPAASGGSKANGTAVQFPDPTGANWGTIYYWSIWDASSGGNCLCYAAVNTPVAVNDGDPGPRFPIGALTVTCD